jgi:hypothetical protein
MQRRISHIIRGVKTMSWCCWVLLLFFLKKKYGNQSENFVTLNN